MKKISDFLDRAINRTGAAKTIKAAVVVEQAGYLLQQIMPQLKIGEYKVLSLKFGTLTIAAISPVLAQEIKMRREPILEVLNETFPNSDIKRLKFVPMPYEYEQ